MAKTGRWITAIATACLLVFLLLLPATQAGRALTSVAEEKRSCQSQSHKFKGKCFSDHNCASVCNSEHFPGGKCVGFRQRCFCTRPC